MKYNAVVSSVDEASIADELGIQPGDVIAKINNKDIVDYLDYKFLSTDEEIEMLVIKPDGSEILFDIYNEYMEDLGINFENMLFDKAKSCKNKCIFCFIDQLPRGMRDTLYFKDDDSRLSFLYGNYVTLTNMKNEDIDRLIEYHISPVNISVHTTNPELRCKMLNNRFAGKVFQYINKLYEHNITMNMQVVLVKNVNDGTELSKTVSDLAYMYPVVNSISIVPVGMTRYREGLFPLEEFSKQDYRAIIAQIEKLQQDYLERYGSRIVYLSDEFYINADAAMPECAAYEDFPQIENGVGLVASMEEEFKTALLKPYTPTNNKKTAIATGTLAYNFIKKLVQSAKMLYNNIDIEVYPIQNNFFGGKVSVTGLICGCDLIAQLKNKKTERLLISRSMLKADEDIFLDDMRTADVEKALDTEVVICDNDGCDFLEKILMK